MSWTQGRGPSGSSGQPHRRLDAGEASRGGEPRVCVSGDQTAGRVHARGAGARPHPGRLAAAAGTAGARRKRARGGAGVRLFLATGLLRPWYRVRGTYSSYARQRACWTRRPDQMVAGVVSAVSAGGDAVGRKGRGGYGVPERERRGGKGSVAHGGCSGRRSRLGEGRTATSR